MKILIVSGFLGAGKTTFIRDAARRIGGSIVVLENEFGEVGVDGDLLSDAPLEVVELAQGCICCSMKTDFLRAVAEIDSRFHPDALLIEPTGIGSLSLILASLSQDMGDGAVLARPVTLVDAEAFLDYLEIFGEFYRDQIVNASTLIVTKSEELPPEERERVFWSLADLNPKAEIVLPPYEELPREWWDRLLEPSGTKCAVPAGNSAALSLESLGLRDLAFRSRDALEECLDRLGSGSFGRIHRIKGIAPAGEGWLRFDVARRRRTIGAWRAEKASSKMTLIGEDLDTVGIREALSEFRIGTV